MKTIKKYYYLVFVFSLVLASCKAYKQNLNDNTAPYCEIGFSLGPTLPVSKTVWGKFKDYIQLDYKKPNQKGREYQFYVSAKDPGGLEKVTIEVCPKDALIPNSINKLEETFDPSKTGGYVVTGRIRPLKRGERISVKVTVKGKDRNGSKTTTTSLYAIANNVRFNMGGRPLENLCKPQTSTSYVRIGLKRPTHTNIGTISYCGCFYHGSLAINSQCRTMPNICQKTRGSIHRNTRGKFIVNENPTHNIEVLDPTGKSHKIPKNGRVSYNGPIYGKWISRITITSGAMPITTYIKIEY